MNEGFGNKDVELLKRHLQAIIAVEFFTIPFYLTAVYSFTQRALDYQPDPKSSAPPPLYNLQQEALSVAVQEMYHLQLACNLANAFDLTPVIPKLSLPAHKEIKIPHLVGAKGEPLTAQLGDLPAAIQAMVDIESPDPDPNYPPPNREVKYRSISDLYNATLQLLAQYLSFHLQASRLKPLSFDPHFKPDNKQIAYATFADTYNYNQITAKDSKFSARELVAKVANAITDQGEGRLVGGNRMRGATQPARSPRVAAAAAMLTSLFTFGDDGQVQKEFQPKAGTRFADYGTVTHFKRFQEIQTTLGDVKQWEEKIGGKVFYPDGKPSPDLPPWAEGMKMKEVQTSLNVVWMYLIDCIRVGFDTGNLPSQGANYRTRGFDEAMLAFKYGLPILWQLGDTPSFGYVGKGVTPAEVQDAMDYIDPLCLFHWDLRTAKLRADASFPRNVCQGLNDCSGKGWGGLATAKGTGACATADLHTCGGNNSCKSEGGCGFLVSKSGEACRTATPSAATSGKASARGGKGAGKAAPAPPTPASEPDALLPPNQEWIPGQNICGKMGGCQAPISPEQVFSRNSGDLIESQPNPPWSDDDKKQVEALKGQNVWQRARDLFAAKEGITKLPDPMPPKKLGKVNYDGSARRKSIQPTSK